MKIIGTAEDADRLLEVLMHIVPYINEVTKTNEKCSRVVRRAAEMKNVSRSWKCWARWTIPCGTH